MFSGIWNWLSEFENGDLSVAYTAFPPPAQGRSLRASCSLGLHLAPQASGLDLRCPPLQDCVSSHSSLAGVSRPEDYNNYCNKALKQLSGMRHLLHSMAVCMFKGSEVRSSLLCRSTLSYWVPGMGTWHSLPDRQHPGKPSPVLVFINSQAYTLSQG